MQYRDFTIWQTHDGIPARAYRGVLGLVFKPLGKKDYWQFQVGGKMMTPVWRYPASPKDVKKAIDGWYYDIGTELDRNGLDLMELLRVKGGGIARRAKVREMSGQEQKKSVRAPKKLTPARAVSHRRSGRAFTAIRKNSSLKLRGWPKEDLATFSKKELEAYEIANENFTMAVDQKESKRNDYPNPRWTIFDAYHENAMDTARSVLGREYVGLTGSLFVDLIRLNKIKDAGWLSSDD